MKKFISLILLLATTIAWSQDLANGKKIWKKVNCALCHGSKGQGKALKLEEIKTLKGPLIAGLDADYIIKQITSIQKNKAKDQGRLKKNYMMMMTKVKKLTAQDIKDVAFYVSKLGPKANSLYGNRFKK